MATLEERNFRCPLTDTACIDGRCTQDQCAQISDNEAKARARKWEIQRQELDDPKYRNAAIRVLEARVSWLNSLDTSLTNDGRIVYSFSSPSGMPHGPAREAVKKQCDELIDKILTSSKYRHLVRAAVDGRPISQGSFAKDEDLDGLFDVGVQLDEL
jgi:hypothetical protein